MFGLCTGYYHMYFNKPEYYVIILGLDCAGKTTLLERIKAIFSNRAPLPPQSIRPTVGLNIGRVEVDGNKLVFWDLGGQESLRTIWPKYYKEAHGLIFVVDSSDPERFEEAKNELEMVIQNPEMSGVPILVLANKMDMPNAETCAKVESVLAVPSLPRACNALRVRPIVATTGEGVMEGVQWIVDEIKSHPRNISFSQDY